MLLLNQLGATNFFHWIGVGVCILVVLMMLLYIGWIVIKLLIPDEDSVDEFVERINGRRWDV